MTIPILDLKAAEDAERREVLLNQLRYTLFNVGFLYITNHGVPEETISNLANWAPALIDLSASAKLKLSKINSPHFLGYSGYAEEITQGKRDLREQFHFATEIPIIYREAKVEQDSFGRDFSKPYWRLRGPNQSLNEKELPGFKTAVLTWVIFEPFSTQFDASIVIMEPFPTFHTSLFTLWKKLSAFRLAHLILSSKARPRNRWQIF